MTEIPVSLLDQVYQYGALPLLLFALYMLWKKNTAIEQKIEKLHAAHKIDLKIHGEEVKTLNQDMTIAIIKLEETIKK